MRVVLAAYFSLSLYLGVTWIHTTAAPSENICGTGTTPGQPGAALTIAAILAASLVLNGYLIAKPPHRWWTILAGVVALAAVSLLAVYVTAVANIGWCGLSAPISTN
jgi:phosphatidylglycerophosphate synthase